MRVNVSSNHQVDRYPVFAVTPDGVNVTEVTDNRDEAHSLGQVKTTYISKYQLNRLLSDAPKTAKISHDGGLLVYLH